jgi:hypothetical protein
MSSVHRTIQIGECPPELLKDAPQKIQDLKGSCILKCNRCHPPTLLKSFRHARAHIAEIHDDLDAFSAADETILDRYLIPYRSFVSSGSCKSFISATIKGKTAKKHGGELFLLPHFFDCLRHV